MNRITVLLHHPDFAGRAAQLKKLEETRSFCRHGLDHSLDVARLMWITALEEHLPLSKEVVYAAALLHDLGRCDQILRGIPHEEASITLARDLLPIVGFSAEEQEEICGAIQTHRGSVPQQERTLLGGLLYRADKESRCCWCCPASLECNWPEEKRNQTIRA